MYTKSSCIFTRIFSRSRTGGQPTRETFAWRSFSSEDRPSTICRLVHIPRPNAAYKSHTLSKRLCEKAVNPTADITSPPKYMNYYNISTNISH